MNVGLVDVSIRDGNQSLWGATGLRTAHILQVAPVLERVGFRALDYTSSTAMGVAVRNHREDPWERIRRTRALMPTTKLQLIGTGFRFISWENSHPETMQLVYDRLAVNGIDRVVVLDPMHDMDAARETARRLKKAGIEEVVGALTFTISAVHDDAFYADLARQMRECPDIDRVYVKDPAGILSADRARTLFPAIKAQLGDTPLELHSHATIGLSMQTYAIAPSLGVEVVQVGCGALGNGSSLPEAQRTVANLREMGHTVDIDDRALDLACRFFDRHAAAEELPVGRPQDFDAAFLHHQIAGGVLTTTRRQLREIGMEDRFESLIEEVGRVRAELGHPIMVTPFPQMVVSQALFNVMGERYANVPDQVIRYAQGTFGRPTAPIQPDVLDRILDRPRARELAAEPPPPSPEELRRRFPGVSDEELLLRAHMPAEQVDAMVAAGPAPDHYNPSLAPVLSLLGELGSRPSVHDLAVTKPGFSLAVRRA
ncbi:biotin carboxyl carrier protein [Petropleomorpha daqingensis]|uniref:Oxaloacetate decarboxylase alpha subunit n=1 Tax=Petropleomorpha daqingensis TaxID=2026353 RepID=A0A853CI38_9ACTN|nr:oxaloacetate decarboxylase alpha subunit [Petropleomorpha daqingensis]